MNDIWAITNQHIKQSERLHKPIVRLLHLYVFMFRQSLINIKRNDKHLLHQRFPRIFTAKQSLLWGQTPFITQELQCYKHKCWNMVLPGFEPGTLYFAYIVLPLHHKTSKHSTCSFTSHLTSSSQGKTVSLQLYPHTAKKNIQWPEFEWWWHEC